MSILLASPALRIAERLDAATMADTDPYSLGFCVSSYQNTGRSELARYAIGAGRTAFISYNLNTGFALVIQDSSGRELFASRLADADEIRAKVSPYII